MLKWFKLIRMDKFLSVLSVSEGELLAFGILKSIVAVS